MQNGDNRKRILVLAHCLLNKASKVEQDESGLSEEYAQRTELLKLIIKSDVQVLQLPCPEFMMYGARRWGHVRDQFDNPFFRAGCRKLLSGILLQLQEYAAHPERFVLLGAVSVEGSPSCGYRLTCRGDWGGELSDLREVKRKTEGLQMTGESGVFMEEFIKALSERHIELPVFPMEAAVRMLRADSV